jgi:hypothetical protein
MQRSMWTPGLKAVSAAPFLSLAVLACSSSGSSRDIGTGGATSSGGAVSAAGQLSTSGTASGGQSNSGGSQSSGGFKVSGGQPSSGGSTTSDGRVSSGGTTASGGQSRSGGVSAGGAAGGSTDTSDGGVDAADAAPMDGDALVQGGALEPTEVQRLHDLGAGTGCDPVTKQDLLLVERGMLSSDSVDRGWAYLAVEKFAHCPDLLDRQFVDTVFSQMLAAAGGADLELARFAGRGLGEVSLYTDLLAANQVSQAYELAMAGLDSRDIDVRGIGLGLLAELVRHLDIAQMYETFRVFFAEFDAWDKSYSGTWRAFTLKVVDIDSTPELRFQSSAIRVFLDCCRYVQDPSQAATAYPVVVSAMNQGKLGSLALPSVAGLARKLSEPERSQAVDLIIGALSSPTAWYDLGSGIPRPANYANDALLIIEPWLDRAQIQRALDTIQSQADHPDYAAVLASTADLLNSRLAELSADAGA